MAFDAHANFAVSAVSTAPTPATSGTSLVVATGQGSRFPAVPFNATIWPSGASPDPTNAEIVRVTARTSDTLTITRAQEGSTARSVVAGDVIAATITAKTLTDMEGANEGLVGIAEITTTSTGTTNATPTDVSGLSVTFTAISGHYYRVAFYGTVISTVAGDRSTVTLREGTTTLQGNGNIDHLSNSSAWFAGLEYTVAPSAGAHTYKISQHRASGTGSVSIYAAATQPAQLTVTDLGVL